MKSKKKEILDCQIIDEAGIRQDPQSIYFGTNFLQSRTEFLWTSYDKGNKSDRSIFKIFHEGVNQGTCSVRIVWDSDRAFRENLTYPLIGFPRREIHCYPPGPWDLERFRLIEGETKHDRCIDWICFNR